MVFRQMPSPQTDSVLSSYNAATMSTARCRFGLAFSVKA